MGSATRESVSAAIDVLTKQGALDATTGEQLLQAALVVDGSPHLRAALADDAADPADRTSIVNAVFGAYTKQAKAVLEALATSRWSTSDDLVGGIEEVGIRAVAASAPSTVSVNDELFAFSTAVSSNSELELALASKLGTAESKRALVAKLLQKKASPQTVTILTSLIVLPRGRRIAELIRHASTIVAQQAGSTIATVTVAAPLTPAQSSRLQKALSVQYGGTIRINEIVDQAIIGGMRVQIGDEIIDGTIANRIADLRLRLAS